MNAKILDYLENLNLVYNENSIEELHIVYLDKNNNCKKIFITKNATKKHGEVFDLDVVINLLIENNINDYILCHNHPEETPIVSDTDYSITQKYYFFQNYLILI